LSINLLACEISAIVQYFEHSLALPFFGIGMKTDLFSPVATAVFSKFAGILSEALSQHPLSGFEIAQLECEVKWALGSITTNKASGGAGIPVELFQTLKDDAVKVLHSICQQFWKTQQWPQD